MSNTTNNLLSLAIKLHMNPDGVDMNNRFDILDQQEKYSKISEYLNSIWIYVLLDISLLLDDSLQSSKFTNLMQTEL